MNDQQSATSEQTNAQPEQFQPLAQSGGATSQPYNQGWSWGGFMLDFVLIIGAKRYAFLWLFILYFIPLVNILAMIGIKIYLGLNGRRIVAESEAFANDDEKRGFLKGLDHAGKIFFFIFLALMAIYALVFIAFLSSMSTLGS